MTSQSFILANKGDVSVIPLADRPVKTQAPTAKMFEQMAQRARQRREAAKKLGEHRSFWGLHTSV
jgi:hypothetical protein